MRNLFRLSPAGVFVRAALTAHVQTLPNKPVTRIVPFDADGTTDSTYRDLETRRQSVSYVNSAAHINFASGSFARERRFVPALKMK